MKNFAEKRPFWFALATTIVITVAGLAAFIIGGKVLNLPEILLAFAPMIIAAAIALGLIHWFGWWRDAGFVSTTNHVYVLGMVVVVMLVVPLVIFGTVETETRIAVFFLLAFFLTGLGEEALSRGLFHRLYLARGKWQAVLIPSLLFGVSHITHLLSGEYTPAQSVIQIANATISGMLYAAVRLRVNNIWPLIIIHTFHDVLFGLGGFGGPNATRGLDDVPTIYFAITWALSLATVAYVMFRTKPTATIDGQAVG